MELYMSVYQRLFLLFLLWVPFAALANEHPVAMIENLDETFDLAPYLEYIEDSDHSITYEDIQQGKVDGRWQRNTKTVFIAKNVKSRYWFRMRLHFSEDFVSSEAVLAVPSQARILGFLKLWLPTGNDDGPKVRTILTGSGTPYESRDIDNKRFGFRIPISSTSSTVLGWVDNSSWGRPALLPLVLQTPEQFSQDGFIAQSIIIVFYTIMITQLIYNLCLFFSLREPLYGVYSLVVIFAALNISVMDGTSVHWFSINEESIHVRLMRIGSYLILFFHLVFVWMSLDRFRYSYRLQQCFKLLMIMSVVFVFHSAVTDHSISVPFQIYSLLCSFFILIVTIQAIVKRHPIAKYILVSEMVMITGIMSFLLMIDGDLPFNSVALWGAHWGIAGEALLLSLVLATRTRLLQQSAIDYLKKYESLFEGSLNGRFIYSIENDTAKYNHAFVTLFGYEKSTDAIKKIRSIASEGEVNYELELKNHKTDSSVWISINTQLQSNVKGKPLTIEGTVFDISERKLKEKAEQENILIEAQAKAKSQFFASMSHELRTPLNVVLGYADIARHRDLGEEKRIKAVETIVHSGKHLLTLINDVLDVSKIEAQKIDVEMLDVSIFDILRDVDEFVGILAEKKGIAFRTNIRYPVPEKIQSDPTRLKQILINLSDNAIKFTEKGGVNIEVIYDAGSEQLSFLVKDTGIGLSPEQIEKLFGAFIQADESITRNFGGTGLGLHLSKKFAILLGGDITIQSEYGQGSTFTLTLDLDVGDSVLADAAPVAISEYPVEPPSLSGNVLYVENNFQSQMLVVEFVERTGCHIDIASNGREGLDLAQKNTYDLVFTDINMPIMDGIEFSEKLLKIYPSIPIVAISANTTISGLEFVGYKEIIEKPISSSTLYRVLAACLTDKLDRTLLEYFSENPTEKVLIIDDDKNIIEILTSFLSPYTKYISAVMDGHDAIGMIENDQFDIVITDYNIPGLNGLEIVSALRADIKNGNTKVLCLTGSTSPGDIKKIYASGVDVYLAKPIDANAFVAGLSQLLKKDRPNKSVSIINIEKMDERFGGMQELTTKTIKNFVEKYQDAPSYLTAILRNNEIEYDVLYLYIHNLANNADLLFASEISALLRNLESLVKNENLDEIVETIASKKLYRLLEGLINEAKSKLSD